MRLPLLLPQSKFSEAHSDTITWLYKNESDNLMFTETARARRRLAMCILRACPALPSPVPVQATVWLRAARLARMHR